MDRRNLSPAGILHMQGKQAFPALQHQVLQKVKFPRISRHKSYGTFSHPGVQNALSLSTSNSLKAIYAPLTQHKRMLPKAPERNRFLTS